MNCRIQEMTTTYNCSQGAVYAEVKPMLASDVTVPSNGFVFRHKKSLTNAFVAMGVANRPASSQVLWSFIAMVRDCD